LAPLRRSRQQIGEIGPKSLTLRLRATDIPGELRPLVEGINTMLTRLEQGYVQLNQFAADLAHELRTPLATLTGQSQVMLSRPRTEAEYSQLLEAQLQELERLGRLVESMLFLARSEHQVLAGQLQRQRLSAADELARQADYFADLAEERDLLLRCQGDAALWAEPVMLRRALANLLSNALRYARPGSVIELVARTEPGAEGALAILEVRNEGEPLPQEVLDRLFDRFYRADDARQSDAAGSGLGLSIVRAILTLHGGTAEALQPAPGHISFLLRFPAIEIAADPAASCVR
jgi:two-component system heavy metal sensor histidine kinase CusS